jgi:hypothetical protein
MCKHVQQSVHALTQACVNSYWIRTCAMSPMRVLASVMPTSSSCWLRRSKLSGVNLFRMPWGDKGAAGSGLEFTTCAYGMVSGGGQASGFQSCARAFSSLLANDSGPQCRGCRIRSTRVCHNAVVYQQSRSSKRIELALLHPLFPHDSCRLLPLLPCSA